MRNLLEVLLGASRATSILGYLIILAAALEALLRLFGVEEIPPATVPDWLRLMAELAGGIGFRLSRDNLVSSESAGAR